MRLLLCSLALAAGLGCATLSPRLVPAPSSRSVEAGRGAAAEARAAGVRIVARAGAWSGKPRTLTAVTPILVTLENEGNRPLRVRYSEFRLVPEQGDPVAALPPFDIDATEVEPVHGGAHPRPIRFRVAPHHARYYPYLDPWHGHYHLHPRYYDMYFPRFRRLDLPTADMVGKAMPEGVLEAGGRLRGFLYFENVPRRADRVTFRAELVDAESDETLGLVEIPFIRG